MGIAAGDPVTAKQDREVRQVKKRSANLLYSTLNNGAVIKLKYRLMKKCILTFLLSVIFAGYCFSQSANTDTSVTNFIKNAVKGGLMEINTGYLAVKKGKNAEIKSFGARMVADHTKSNNELKSIITKKGWKISMPPATVVAPDAMLIKSTGSDFDRSYVNMMVKDHKKTIALFKRAAASSLDQQLKAFAAKTLPILSEHYLLIQKIGDRNHIIYEK